MHVKKIGEDNVSFEDICHFFGPMKNKNGWLYKDVCAAEVIAEIKDLWWRVYEQDQIVNKQLLVHFARA